MAWGLPTMLDRPTMTQCLRGGRCRTPGASASPRRGCRAGSRSPPIISCPTLKGWKQSTSLSGRMASRTSFSFRCLGRGSLHQNAVDVLPGRSGCPPAPAAPAGWFPPGWRTPRCRCRTLRSPFSFRLRTPGGGVVPHQHHGQSGLALHPLHLARTSSFTLAARPFVHYYRCHGLLLLVIAFVVGFLLRLGLEAVTYSLAGSVGPEAVVEQDGPPPPQSTPPPPSGTPGWAPQTAPGKEVQAVGGQALDPGPARPYQHR